MAELMLTKPQAGEQVTLEAIADAQIAFGFATDEALMERVDDNLVFSFEDGSSVTLTDFYTAYTKDNMPNFIVDGAVIEGEQFFAALDSSLMPAAGPAAGPQGAGGRFRSYTDMDLLNGIDRLDGLDLGLTEDTEVQDDLYGLGGAAAPVAAVTGVPTAPIIPSVPGQPNVPGEPSVPGGPDIPGEPDVPGEPEVPSNHDPIVSINGKVEVEESGVFKGGNQANPGTPQASGSITATDADGDPLTFGFVHDGQQVNSITATFGTITMDENGNYTYILNNDSANSLALGENRTETFTVYVSDGKGGFVTQEINVNIIGTNDQPTLELSKEAFELTKDSGTTTLTGTAAGEDVDSNAELTYTFKDGSTEIKDDYGTLTIDPKTGVYTYVLDNDSEKVQGLSDEDSIEQKITVWVKDEHGAYSTKELTITIKGTNDAPTIEATNDWVKESGVKDGGNIAETGKLTATGHVTIADADDDITAGTHEFRFVDAQGNDLGNSITTKYGTITIDRTTGEYTYVLNDGAVNNLGQGETLEDVFNVQVNDQQGGKTDAPITITINGTNDKPTLEIAGSTPPDGDHNNPTLVFTEKGVDASNKPMGQDSASANAKGDDVDNGDNANLKYSFTGADGKPVTSMDLTDETSGDKYGTLTIDQATGKIIFTPNEEVVNPMGVGEHKDFNNITVRVTDGHGAWSEKPVDVHIEGTNDAPVISTSDPTSYNVYEAGVLHGGNIERTQDNDSKTDDLLLVKGSVTATDVEGNTLSFAVKGGDKYIGNVKPVDAPEKGDNWSKLSVDTGDFYLNKVTGEYEFVVKNDNKLVAEMNEGNQYTRIFTITVADGKGGYDTQNITIVLKGSNDKPEINAYDSELTINEGTHSTSSDMATEVKDVDKGDTKTFFVTKADAEGKHAVDNKGNEIDMSGKTPADASQKEIKYDGYGTLTIDSNGKCTFILDNTSDLVKGMSTGESHTITFYVGVRDTNGAFDLKPVTVTIRGQNDTPYFQTDAHVATITEDGMLNWSNDPNHAKSTIEGTVKAMDDDTADKNALTYRLTGEGVEIKTHTDANGNVISTSVETAYGTITLNLDGTYTYTLKNGGIVQALKPGDTYKDAFTVTVTDSKGLEDSQDLHVNINGTNDQPTIANAETMSLSIYEDGGTNNVLTGKIEASDVDTPVELLSYSLVDAQGNLVQTGQGASGSDPVIHGKYGYLTLNQMDGTYTYTLYNDAAQHLGNGEKATEEFRVRVTDNLKASADGKITVTINGTDDKPTLENSSASLTEREGTASTEGQTTTGQVTAHDADATDTQTFYFLNEKGEHVTTLTGKYGSITIDPVTGKYTYTLTQNLQELGAGQSLTDENFTVHVDSGNTSGETGTADANIDITITGTNDAPVISGEYVEHVSAGVNPTETGTVVATDIDKGDTLTYHFMVDGEAVQTIDGKYGSITIDPKTGEYTYTLNINSKDYIDLTGNQRGDDEIFNVTVRDQHGSSDSQNITIKVTGSDEDGPGSGGGEPEIPTINPPADITVTEDGNISASGKFSQGTPPADVAGEHLPKFSFMVNGQPVQTIQGQYGAITINPQTGEYTYTLNNYHPDVQALNAGDALRGENFEVFLYGKTTGEEITVVVNGTDDKPVIDSYDAALSYTEGGSQNIMSGTVAGHDVDSNSKVEYYFLNAQGERVSTITTKDYSITLDPKTGQYTYTILNPETHRNADFALNDTIRVVAHDTATGVNSESENINVTMNGVNNGPTIAEGDYTLGVQEDVGIHNGLVQASGQMHVNDDAAGLKYAVGTEGKSTLFLPEGTVTIDANGKYVFTLNNDHASIQGLSEGELHTIRFNVQVTDKHGAVNNKEVTINILGSNDAPALFVDKPVLNVQEATGPNVVGGQVEVHDVDGDKLTFSFDNPSVTEQGDWAYVNNIYGVFSINTKTGEYKFTLNNDSDAVIALKQGQLVETTIKIIVSDGHGGADTKDFTVNIEGSNTAPVLKADKPENLQLTEDGDIANTTPLTVGGTITDYVSDPDNDSKLTYTFVKGTSVLEKTDPLGTFKLNADGTFAFTLNQDEAAKLGEGATKDVIFYVLAVDQHGAVTQVPVTITVTGSNDDPVITGSNTHSLNEDAAKPITGTINATDVDEGDKLTFTINNADEHGKGNGQYGTLSIDPATGKYTYTLNENAQTLGKGDNVEEKFTITVSDGHGGTVNQEVSFKVAGVNDLPVFTTPEHITDLIGTFAATDIDGDTLKFYLRDDATDGLKDGSLAGKYGTLVLNSDGTYSYTPNDSLNPGEQYHDKFWVQVDDGNGKLVDKEFVIDVTGTPNDSDAGHGSGAGHSFSAGHDADAGSHADANAHMTGFSLFNEGEDMFRGVDFDSLASQNQNVDPSASPLAYGADEPSYAELFDTNSMDALLSPEHGLEMGIQPTAHEQGLVEQSSLTNLELVAQNVPTGAELAPFTPEVVEGHDMAQPAMSVPEDTGHIDATHDAMVKTLADSGAQ